MVSKTGLVVPISQGCSENQTCHSSRGLCRVGWAPARPLWPGPWVPHCGAGRWGSNSAPALRLRSGWASEPSTIWNHRGLGCRWQVEQCAWPSGKLSPLHAVLLPLTSGCPGTLSLGTSAGRARAWLWNHSKSHHGKDSPICQHRKAYKSKRYHENRTDWGEVPAVLVSVFYSTVQINPKNSLKTQLEKGMNS